MNPALTRCRLSQAQAGDTTGTPAAVLSTETL